MSMLERAHAEIQSIQSQLEQVTRERDNLQTRYNHTTNHAGDNLADDFLEMTQLKQLMEENESLQSQLEHTTRELEARKEQIEKLQVVVDKWQQKAEQKLVRAREALKFYADKENYDLRHKVKDEHGSRWVCATEDDEGEIAQQALKEIDQCEHGKGLTEYCQPCGRINSA